MPPTIFHAQDRNNQCNAANEALNRINSSSRFFLPLLLWLLLTSISATAQDKPRTGSTATSPPEAGKSAPDNGKTARLLHRDQTEAAELKSMSATLENQNLREWLQKLIEERREFDATDEQRQEWGRHLPYRLNDFVDARKSQQLAHVAGKVFELFKAPNRELIVYRSEKPLIMTWKGYFVLLSSSIADDFSDAEIAGLVAHEAAHLIFTEELRRAFEAKDDAAARSIELQCDAAAITALDLLGLPPTAYISALEKMTRARKQFGIDDGLDRLHPSAAARRRLTKTVIDHLTRQQLAKNSRANKRQSQQR